ncbi:MAG: Crossover junction endonuclease mus81 [Vezdaea aestivalis]|nr:MAG: Crossover junction endonuclease mus81 [Vezdaea aestivalis]
MAVECANPVLLAFLEEMRDLAGERNSKGRITYNRAWESMKACPITFEHPADAAVLRGLGPKICEKLTEKLIKYNQENGLPPPRRNRAKRNIAGEDPLLEPPPSPPKKRKTTKKPYVPKLRSGPYAALLVLAGIGEHSSRKMTRAQLVDAAQPHCDVSFTATSDARSHYTAWDSLKRLIDSQGLIGRSGSSIYKYYLTEEGLALADSIRGTTNDPELPVLSPKRSSPQRFPRGTQETILISSAELPTLRLPGTMVHGANATAAPHLPGPTSTRTAAMPPKPRSAAHFIDFSDEDDDWPMPISPTFRVQAESRPTQQLPNPSFQPRPLAFHPTQPATQAQTQPSIPAFNPVTIPPGAFTVELILDNREIRTLDDRTYIQDELRKHDVNPTIRGLVLGDVIWTARVKNPSQYGLEAHSDESAEVMLDYIIERKRLDDLVASLQDGRFKEQKFRLHKTAVKNVIYLVEDMTVAAEMQARWGEKLDSSIANTQVLDGFFLKRTSKLDETIRYLARMTRLLKSMYESKPLHIVPSEMVTPENHRELRGDFYKPNGQLTPLYIAYPVFRGLCSKDEGLTLRDVFLKMLMCTRGITGEKALELQAKWPTPRLFWEAYEACRDQAARNNMVDAELGKLVGTRKVGAGLSVKLAEIWGPQG